MKKFSLLVSAVFLTSLCWIGTAQANVINCPADIADNVVTNSGCQYVDPFTGQTNDSAALINSEAFFGTTTWSFSSKDETASATGQSGTWDTTGIAANFDVLLIFKDGNGSSLVGYLVAAGSSGTWTSPYECSLFNCSVTPKDVSHISTYISDPNVPPAAVPEPGTMLLLGSGLAGLGLWRWKTAKKA